MKHKTAERVNVAVLEASRSLEESITYVAEGEDGTEFQKYRDVVSHILVAILFDILNPLYRQYPDLAPKGLPLPGPEHNPPTEGETGL